MTFMHKYKWLLLTLAGAAILCLSLGTRQTFGLFLPAITADLGISRQAFALAIAFQNLLWGFVQPFVGMIADRYGAGRVIGSGCLFYLAGLLVMGNASGILTLNLGAGLLVGLGMSATGFAVVLGAVGRLVSERQRTVALALASAGGSFGQFAMIPVGQAFLSSYGWQTALALLGIFALLMGPLAIAVRNRGGEATPALEAIAASPLAALREAFGHRGYKMLTMGFFVCGFHVVFIAVHLPAYLRDLGFAPGLGATALTLIGLANIFGTYAWGHLGGLFRKKRALSTLYGLRSLVLLAFILLPKTEVTVLAFALCMGALWLGTVPLTSGLVAQIFGARYLSTLFGVVFLGHQLGAFLGAWLGGFVFDRTGSYDAVWIVACALSVMATLIHLAIDDASVPGNRPPFCKRRQPLPLCTAGSKRRSRRGSADSFAPQARSSPTNRTRPCPAQRQALSFGSLLWARQRKEPGGRPGPAKLILVFELKGGLKRGVRRLRSKGTGTFGASPPSPTPLRPKPHGEDAAALRRAEQLDAATVGLDDAIGDRKPQAGASRLGGEKGVEDLRLELLRNPRPAVRHGDPDLTGGEATLDPQAPCPRHGLQPVDDQVSEHLAQPLAIPLAQRQVPGRVELDGHLLQRHMMPDLLDDLAEQAIDVDLRVAQALLAREHQKILGDPRYAVHLVQHFVRLIVTFRPGREGHLQDFGVAADNRGGIVDLVGDPGGEFPDGGQFLSARQLLLGAHQLEALGLEFRGSLADLQFEPAVEAMEFLLLASQGDGHDLEAAGQVADLVIVRVR